MAMETEALGTEHSDIMLDLSYDFHGKRMATCSADRTVKIWTSDPGTGKWRCTAEWQAHDGAVMRVRWAHPEFCASLIATCGFDCKAIIWEENLGTNSWQQMSVFLESRSELNDLAFAPPGSGLRLATVSNEGLVRVYASIDPSNLKLWSLMEQFYGGRIVNPPVKLNAISWNPSAVDSPGIVVATSDGTSCLWKHDVTTRSWRMTNVLIGHEGPVFTVVWAPNPGRPYHLLASAGEDAKILLFKIPLEQVLPGKTTKAPEVKPFATLTGHKGPIWRAEWNVSGTALATSGEDVTRLWQSRAHDSSQWYCIGTVDPAST